MASILILFAHPALEKSRVNRAMVDAVIDLPGVTFRDLYELYPTFHVKAPPEQEMLTEHDVIIVQHPFYWYSTPALVKQWEDVVLQHGWAYGTGGTALQGKRFLTAVTAGGSREAYRMEGKHHSTMRQLLLPMQKTVELCSMTYLPPFVVFGTHRMEQADIDQAAHTYSHIIEALRDDTLDMEALSHYPFFNTYLEHTDFVEESGHMLRGEYNGIVENLQTDLAGNNRTDEDTSQPKEQVA